MNKALLRSVDELIEQYSAPEVVEAIIEAAVRSKARLKKLGLSEAQGWESVETALRAALAEIEG